MMVIIIGENIAHYCQIKKRDITKRFYVFRNQCYYIIPECFRQLEIKHNGAWVRTETVIVFDENNPIPYFCKHPEYYDMDARLVAIDESKLMHPKTRGWRGWFSGGASSPWRQFLAGLPLLVVVFIIIWGVIFG